MNPGMNGIIWPKMCQAIAHLEIRISPGVRRLSSVRRSCFTSFAALPCHRAPRNQNRLRNRRGLRRRLNRAFNLLAARVASRAEFMELLYYSRWLT